jgi:cytoskeletal protein RodZ
MLALADPLAVVGGILFAPLQVNIRLELLFVMIVFPGFLNVIYFWIADSFLQAKAEHKEAHEEDHTIEDKREALLTEAFPVEDPVAAVRPWTDVDAKTLDTKEIALV